MSNPTNTICVRCGSRTRLGRSYCAACEREVAKLRTDNEHRISVIAKAARELGMSYGQAVARYGASELLALAGMAAPPTKKKRRA